MENGTGFLNRMFHLTENHTTVRTEVLAGITTCLLYTSPSPRDS